MSPLASKTDGSFSRVSRLVERAFPMPQLFLPAAAGIDISDGSIKWLVLERTGFGSRVANCGELSLAPGIVVSGVIKDIEALSAALREVRKRLGRVQAAHSALPEEAAYVFSMAVPRATSREQTLRMIEFEFEGRIPIPPAAAVYDYTIIPSEEVGEMDEIGVVVFPKDLAEAYTRAFEEAGISLLSLELEARSIARAITSGTPDEPVTLVADFGRARTGFAVLKRGIPIFTSTVDVGGDRMVRTLVEKVNMTEVEAIRFKNEEGLNAKKTNMPAVEAISGTASALADEVARHYHYWDTRRNDKGVRMTPVGKLILVGGNANLAGLSEYLAGRIQAPVEVGQCWRNVASFDDYIPPIDRRISLQYATAIGLALRAL